MKNDNIGINTSDNEASKIRPPVLPPIQKVPLKLPGGDSITSPLLRTENTSQEPEKTTTMDSNPIITQTSDLLKNINIIKEELCKLPLDPCELEYITIRVNPLMNIIYELANATSNLAASVTYLQNSPVVHPKKSELKDTIHLMYDLNEECEDVFKELKRRINKVLKD